MENGIEKFFNSLKHLNGELVPKELANGKFSFELFGLKFMFTDTILTMWMIMAVIIFFAYFFTRKLEFIPSKKQNFIEMVVEGINNLTKDILHSHWRGFAPYFGTILLFLAVSNIISLFNIFPMYSIRPPTKDINVTSSMAIMSILLVIGASIKYKGFKGFSKSFVKPMAVMLPFNLMEFIIKPLSLCLRLFGNILAAFAVMEIVYFFADSMNLFVLPPLIPAFASMYFDLFDGLLQAYIFTFLTLLYVEEAIE
jgi:F-type H+-transporting ATPase subunit a